MEAALEKERKASNNHFPQSNPLSLIVQVDAEVLLFYRRGRRAKESLLFGNITAKS
jgi:hypothetical protein